MKVRFVLLSEGTSEEPLVPHLETLCLLAGADEAAGSFPRLDMLPNPGGRTVAEKLVTARNLEPTADLFFVHRDANSAGREARLAEIASAFDETGPQLPWVGVIPCKELEAWLLTDESAIRRAVGRPSAQSPLSLPKLAKIESDPDPKSTLRNALVAASGATGRRLPKVRRQFSEHRRILLQRLNLDGPLRQLPSWRALVDDTSRVVGRMVDRASGRTR